MQTLYETNKIVSHRMSSMLLQFTTVSKKDDITDDLKIYKEIIEVDLGKKPKWIATGETPSGKVAIMKLDTYTLVTMQSTCMILAHRQKLKGT